MYDNEALYAMAASTAVVASAVRTNSAIASDAVITACLAAGTHYTDLQPKPGALRHIVARFDKAARDAAVLLAPGCGFDYAVPDVAAAVAERRFQEAFGRAPARVRQVFIVRPGPQGMAFSTKWIDALLTNHTKPRRSHATTQSLDVNAATSPEAQRLRPVASTVTGRGVPNLGTADNCHVYARSGADTPCAAADSYLTLVKESDLPPLVPGRGPLLSYCPELRAWTVPFPLGGAAARFLFARRHDEEESQQQQLHMAGSSNLAGTGGDAGTEAGLEGAAEAISQVRRGPELDSRIVFPLPMPITRLLGFALLALPLLPLALPFMLVWMVLCWLVLWLAVLPGSALLLAARRWAFARRLLQHLAPVMTLGLVTNDEVRAVQVTRGLRFEMVLTVEPQAAAAPANMTTPRGAAAAAAEAERAAMERNAPEEQQQQRHEHPEWLRLHLAGPAPGQWRCLTSVCLVQSALQLLVAAKEAVGGRAVEEAMMTVEDPTASEGEGLNSALSQHGRAALRGVRPWKVPRLKSSGGVVTPAQLLATKDCGFWDILQRDLGVHVREEVHYVG
ncbi:hypothetical protein Vretimale_555 [Volvox reticuliferus]|uniref:Uncharacterized protein n=1 Tax=Volvox reticuliferus TaxID=1737510 RepID=A0A8J4D2T6_9CHLO|nr:hypothetical protein Vretimale_555 [Volvox reticuliferus]